MPLVLATVLGALWLVAVVPRIGLRNADAVVGFVIRCALLALAALALALPCAAQWKWRDAQGHIQYSDRPPPNEVRDRDILTRPAAAPAAQRPAQGASAAAGAPSGVASAPTSDAAIEARKRQAQTYYVECETHHDKLERKAYTLDLATNRAR